MSAQKQTPFQTIEQACKTTGLSMYYLRRGCWAGTVPHVKSGRVVVHLLGEMEDTQSLVISLCSGCRSEGPEPVR